MLAILSITFPIFALIALGYGVTRGGLFKPAEMRIFGRYLLNIAMPALIFNAVASRPAAEVFNLSYMSVYLAGGLATMAVSFLWFTSTGVDPSRRAVALMGSSCPNSGFVGYPMMLMALPHLAGPVLAMNMLVENVVLIPLALMAMEMARPAEGHHHIGRKIAAVLAGLLRRPMIIGLLIGLVVSLTGFRTPEPVMRVIEMVATTAAPLALIVIGGSLVGLPIRGNRALAGQIVAGKLIVHPALTALAFIALSALGWVHLDGELLAALILTAALPVISIYVVFAQEQGHEGLASIVQLTGTVAAFVTLNLLLSVLL